MRTGVSQQYISALERGRRNLTVLALAELAGALDSTPAALITPEYMPIPRRRQPVPRSRQDGSQRCCQSNPNLSPPRRNEPKPNWPSGYDCPPLGQGRGASLFVDLAAVLSDQIYGGGFAPRLPRFSGATALPRNTSGDAAAGHLGYQAICLTKCEIGGLTSHAFGLMLPTAGSNA